MQKKLFEIKKEKMSSLFGKGQLLEVIDVVSSLVPEANICDKCNCIHIK